MKHEFPKQPPCSYKKRSINNLIKKKSTFENPYSLRKGTTLSPVFNIQFCSSHPEKSTYNAACENNDSFFFGGGVKVQFRGPELYKEKQGIKQEESSLPRIFRPSSFDWQTFHHVYTAFWCISLWKHHKSPLKKIGNITMFDGWRPDHDVTIAGVRGHHSIESRYVFKPISHCDTMITTSLTGSRSSGTLVENGR